MTTPAGAFVGAAEAGVASSMVPASGATRARAAILEIGWRIKRLPVEGNEDAAAVPVKVRSVLSQSTGKVNFFPI
ncbi:hypothetical protein GCM10017600_11290 [Streptosporangium carneum]|uniref:Uncharacterized protein n=1 Tax=Streptosporangium carneum TaxID=47481 RepID=A0A9W6HY03_9ACTN|nr:hypothetical protein GCM10017600_11290 [Streptosporangium carneum]